MSDSNPLALADALVDWISALPADLAFLFALPFAIAVIALLADWWRSRRRGAQPARYASRSRASMNRIT